MKRFTNTDLSKSITHGDRLLIVIDDRVHDVSGWVNSHPGGSSLLRRYRGRDASDVFHAFHGPEVTKKLRAFDVGGVGTGSGTGTNSTLIRLLPRREKPRRSGRCATSCGTKARSSLTRARCLANWPACFSSWGSRCG